MSVILHLSDLHLDPGANDREPILDALVAAVEADRRDRAREVDVVVITGDVFDTANLDPTAASRRFMQLLERIHGALDSAPPTVIVPGNHDRRIRGIVGPERNDLLRALAEQTPPHVLVHGTRPPFLAELVPAEFHQQPLHLIAYDSAHLPRGLLGAGGTMRTEDLLCAAAKIGDRNPDWPVLLLLHHHLVPTPVTDEDPIDADAQPRLLQWGLERVLPKLLANSDREEWMVTALGSGSALSMLHTLRRPVLVLHGHKHNPTARLLKSTRVDGGDVVICSAGSAGCAQSVRQSATRRSARIWPSFNMVELSPEALQVEAVSFGYAGKARGALDVRSMICAARERAAWNVVPSLDVRVRVGDGDDEPRVGLDAMHVRLAARENVYDMHVRRTLEADPVAGRPPHYVDTVHTDGTLVVDGDDCETPHALALSIAEPRDYRIRGGLPRTLAQAQERSGIDAIPYATVDHLCRYRARKARLVVTGVPDPDAAFGSACDAGTGLVRPVPLRREDEHLVLEVDRCDARTELRISWPLAEVASGTSLATAG
ncbi:MAG: metallophosphoesterase [Deltaproteobacteria bacterium]|nr:metallophosphoesterase [Deltaproteobacteria bacterium]